MCSSFYLIGIDPGNNTGVAIYELDSITLDILSIRTQTFVLNDHIPVNIDTLLHRNLLLNKFCNTLSYIYNPNVLALETAFLNTRFPKAVMQLSQYTSTIEQTFYLNNNFIKIFKYPPKLIKKYIGGGGSADKSDMYNTVSNIEEITNNINIDLTSEHEIDALAIGYITILNIREYPHLLISY